jgi:Ca-activated chloride channel homolog
MPKRYAAVLLILFLLFGSAFMATAQEDSSNNTVFRVTVELVQLNVAVIDGKGDYVTNLRPSDFAISEDAIPQKVATFEEGDQGPQILVAAANSPSTASASTQGAQQKQLGSATSGASVFVLFDTSNYMYRTFVYAQDAISEFVHSLNESARVAFYSYSRDVSRDALLSSDRSQVMKGVRSIVAGADAALYNALLLVLNDARQYQGRKVVVVFSNGPDNASMVPPEGVAELAQSEGIPIYMISTRDAKLDPINTAVFERMSTSTGGQAYFAKNWRDEQQAFASVREDLAHLYSLSYYPQPNPNRGWRTISVKLLGDKAKKGYHIRTRNGYRPKPAFATADTSLLPQGIR